MRRWSCTEGIPDQLGDLIMTNFDQEIQMAKDSAKSAAILEQYTASELYEIVSKIWQARKDGNKDLVKQLKEEYINL
jgi:NTP pyrophosphatase (non-canonical NTP hydrolase)